MEHIMKLKAIYFDKIKAGEKIYEIRLNEEKRKLIKIGDYIVFKKEPDLTENLSVKVVDLIAFKSFDEMIKSLGAKDIGFEGKSNEQVIETYHQFYSSQDENKYGVLAIGIELI